MSYSSIFFIFFSTVLYFQYIIREKVEMIEIIYILSDRDNILHGIKLHISYKCVALTFFVNRTADIILHFSLIEIKIKKKFNY